MDDRSKGDQKTVEFPVHLKVLVSVKLLNSISFNKLIYIDLIMATFPCKSNKQKR